MKVNELKDRSPVDVIVLEVTEKAEPRTFHSGTLVNCMAKDETGSVKLTLWNDDVEKVKVGDIVKIEKGWCGSFQGDLQISTGKFGTLTIEGKNDAGSEASSDPLVEEEDMR